MDAESCDPAYEARSLIREISNLVEQGSGFGAFSASVYDSAWVSIVTTSGKSGSSIWAFPECFQFILKTQLRGGLWPRYNSQVDCILNSLAGLYALVIHQQKKLTPTDSGADIDSRIEKAKGALASELESWDVSECVHVGFEILVPNLLRRLGRCGIEFSFSGLVLLNRLRVQKAELFRPEVLYLPQQTTLLHSLEAFIGEVDFHKLRHHRINGSFLGSPSSTAAYLLSSPEYDSEAYAFIRTALGSTGSGGVPSAYPTSVFESSGVISALLDTSLSSDELGRDETETIALFLQKTLDDQNGLLGFAPGYLSDADDTAKCINVLNILGKFPDIKPMIEEFSGHECFRTYRSESNASFSTNCNVLLALLSSRDPSGYGPEILKSVRFLCNQWEKGPICDKWNLSEGYSWMLLTSVLIAILREKDAGRLEKTFDNLISEKVGLIMLQVLLRIVKSQDQNGSWNSSPETTAYAILALNHISKLPWEKNIRDTVTECWQKGRGFLAPHKSFDTVQYLWIEKVSYGSPFLARSYVLAALNVYLREIKWSESTKHLLRLSTVAAGGVSGFFSKIPLLSNLDRAVIDLSSSEATIYYRRLADIRLEVFPRKGMTEDKYLKYIPVTWTSCNALNNFALPNEILWDMMVISMLNYQIDEYMEAVVANLSELQIKLLKTTIQDKCDWRNHLSTLEQSGEYIGKSGRHLHRPPPTPPTPNVQGSPMTESLGDAFNAIEKYINHFQYHHATLNASDDIREALGRELATFFLAHISQNSHNRRFESQIQLQNTTREYGEQTDLYTYQDPGITYSEWVHTTAANHTSCPFSFAFFCCLISTNTSQYCLPGARQRYFGQALCRHLATMCRQYNDYGSLQRDQSEKNLNSLNFPEFSYLPDHGELRFGESTLPNEAEVKQKSAANHGHGGQGHIDVAKQELMDMAEFERQGINAAMAKLQKIIDARSFVSFQTFVDVTDLYGQIYVARDIASRMK